MGELDETINEAIERSHAAHGHGGPGRGVGKFTLNAVVAISVAITATFSALCHVKDENISEKMQHVQAQSVDAWAYYQAKGTKMNVAEAALDTMRLQRDLTPGLTAEARATLDGKLADYAEKIRHYGGEREEIKRHAEDLEATYDRLEARDDQFDLAEAAASVAIALFGISALTQRRRLLFVAWGFAGVGVVVGLAGFAGLGLHVDFVARALR
ncbi:MAG TPA: DUF4337 domain-containing protein [Polyangia bacterium]|nr:DUF4337 domain-containing protein [Polyangia bacterium]